MPSKEPAGIAGKIVKKLTGYLGDAARKAADRNKKMKEELDKLK